MPSLPGSNLWESALVGYTVPSDWDFNNGGVIEFDDGTLWSYESESPAWGDQDQGYYPYYWINILERKPGSDAWEALTPDTWGQPVNDHPPGYPKWPDFYNRGDYDGTGFLDFSNVDSKGPLNVAHVGFEGTSWVHVLDPADPDHVWFYTRYGDEDLGPIKVNRHDRTWERFIQTAASRDLWAEIASNMVVQGPYFWFLKYPTDSWQSDKGMRLCRAEISNPDNVQVMHSYSSPNGWNEDQITTDLAFPDFLDNQYLERSTGWSIALDGDELYIFSHYNPKILDSRTTGTTYTGSGTNYDMEYSYLKRTKLGDYTLELLYWHTSPQGFVGVDPGSGTYGTYYSATRGIWNTPSMTDDYYNFYEAIGMGFYPSGAYDAKVVDGWLYWVDWSSRDLNNAFGDPSMICRIELSRLNSGVPIQHDGLNPVFEIVTNGTHPWEGNAGHWGRSGTRIYQRHGAQPLMPRMDNTLTFSTDGSILLKGMAFPNYLNYASGYGRRGIWSLTPPTLQTTVTVTFDGYELKGYPNVRQVPVTRDIVEVELS